MKRDYQKGYWLNRESRNFLANGYLTPGQTPEQRIREIAEAAEKYLKSPGFADKFEDYMMRGWISLASPVWSNFGNDKGLPVSCNGTYMGDSVDSILEAVAEIGKMTKLGAGTSVVVSDVRERGSEISTGGVADGPVHYLEPVESIVQNISQGSMRRGNCASYMSVTHPDIKEYLNIREEFSKIHHLSTGVTIPDWWMEEMIAGDKEKRRIWVRIIQRRFETGFPYIVFIDTMNRNTFQGYKDLGYVIHASNLCSEIALPSSEEESFVCCLSSLNLLHFDDWKNTDLVEIMVAFLDAVIEEYIQKTAGMKFMERAHRFAKNHRAIGLGVLGWHSYLQSKMISFSSLEAKIENAIIHRLIEERSLKASQDLAVRLGEPEGFKGYGVRNTTRLAIAPTTSSSFILGQVSPSVEPLASNYFIKDLQKGKTTYKNPFLIELLEEKGMNSREVWDQILLAGGSVKGLDFLSDSEKEVFATFGEIPQIEIITQAAQRQKHIDQSQSINLMIHPDASVNDVSKLYVEAWKLGVKSLYYARSTNPAQELSRDLLTCVACEA